MTKRLKEIYNKFWDFYQKTLTRRLLIGLYVGSMVWFIIFTVTNLLSIIGIDDIWLRTFLHDLPLMGAILALLVTLQIWGLLPQPTSSNLDVLNDFEVEQSVANHNVTETDE
ncbi:MAG: hypothetical protein ACFFDC_21415 [Promethearchaeota archaeon]